MRAPFHPGWLVLAPFVIGPAATALHAQESASLEISVRSADEAQPLPGAEVYVIGLNAGGVTDRNGLLRLTRLPPGRWMIAIRFLGYASFVKAVDLQPGEATSIVAALELEAIGLAPVEVATQSNLARRGFYQRKAAGTGTFLNREQIEKIRPRHLSDVLRGVGGITVGSDSRGLPPARIRGQQTIAGGCPIQYFVDGVMTFRYNIDEMRPEDVEGIEIYRGAASIPPDFKRGTATCGVIVLWTRVR